MILVRLLGILIIKINKHLCWVMNVRPDAVDDIFIIIVDQLPTSSLQAQFINKLQKHESRAGVSEGRGSQMGVLHTNKRPRGWQGDGWRK